jgi:hypothetical protein
LLIALALAVIAWQIAKQGIDVDQYRPRVESALAQYTGLPVAIGSLELAWHPVPCLSVHDVSIGEGDFHAATARLDIFPSWLSLLRWRWEIDRIALAKPALTLPATREEGESQWRSLFEHFRAAQGESTGPTGAPLRIDEILADGASLRFGQDDPHPIRTSVTASGIGGEAIDFTLEAEMPTTGAHATGSLRMPTKEGGEVAGELEIHGVQPQAFTALPEIAHCDWQAEAHLSGTFGGELALALDGSFEPIAKRALSGTFTGHAKISATGKTRAELEVSGEGLAMSATARLFAGDRSRVRVKSLSARDQALASLLAAIARDPIDLSAAKDAALELRDFQIALAGAPRIISGVLEAHGLELSLRGKPIARGLKLDVRADEGGIRIAELRGGPVDLRGAITPADEAHRAALDLTGTIALDDALVHALGAPEAVREAHGAIAIEELRVELPGAAPAGVAYAARAQLAGGAFQIESDAISETISALELQLAGDAAALRVDAHAQGAALGPVSANAAIDPASGAVRGTLSLALASGDFLRDPGSRAHLTPVLRAWSGAPLAFEVQSEAGPPALQRIRLERADAPRLTAALVLRSDPPEDKLRDLDVSADLPADLVHGFLPQQWQTTGAGSLRARRSEGGAGFFVEADLAGLGVAVGPYLDKKAGEALKVRVEGEVGAKGSWVPRRVIVAGEQGADLAADRRARRLRARRRRRSRGVRVPARGRRTRVGARAARPRRRDQGGRAPADRRAAVGDARPRRRRGEWRDRGVGARLGSARIARARRRQRRDDRPRGEGRADHRRTARRARRRAIRARDPRRGAGAASDRPCARTAGVGHARDRARTRGLRARGRPALQRHGEVRAGTTST